MKKFITCFLALTLVFLMGACGKDEPKKDIYITTEPVPVTEAPNLNTNPQIQQIPNTEVVIVTAPTEKESTTVKATEEATTEATTQVTEASTTAETIVETTKSPVEKTGEMEFSDKADNRYIASIVKKYKVPADNLACFYTVPLNDSNIVLEFDGSKNSQGKPIRNKDTLIAIYTINKNLESKRASENEELNEYSYGEMKVIFLSVTKYIMPKFQSQLDS